MKRSNDSVSLVANRKTGIDQPVRESRHDAREDRVHLAKSMLVRLNIRTSCGGTTPILCICHEVSRIGLNLTLPCSLGLSHGDLLEMELFTLLRDPPVAVRALVQHVSRSACDDMVRYSAAVRFCSLPVSAEKEIHAFIRSMELRQRHRMPI